MSYELVDFGNQCLPNDLIRKILKNKTKHLFMLGVYSFNDISTFLERGSFEDIYKKEYLMYNDNPITHFTNDIERYTHASVIKNTHYNFTFNHDFLYDISTNTIRNYDFIRNEFDKKISNLKELFINDKTPIFINFLFHQNYELKLEKMVSVLKQYMKKPFYIFIFTSCKSTGENGTLYENIKFIYLDQDYTEWWKQTKDIKLSLYKEIYEKYVDTIQTFIIKDTFVPFEELDMLL